MLQQGLCVHVWVYTTTDLQRADSCTTGKYPTSWTTLSVICSLSQLFLLYQHTTCLKNFKLWGMFHVPHYFISINYHGNGTEEGWGRS